jgi:16S rRNA C967 or C1407 C5-methylase (RsmB/RsmF family)
MKTPFREHHLFTILTLFEAQSLPLDVFLRNYFRAHSAVGSKDRKMLCETIYGMIRWRGLIDYLCRSSSWKERYQSFLHFSPEKQISDPSIPPHIRASFPKEFYALLEESLGKERAFAFCLSCNEPAPTTIRVNALKSSREALLNLWKGQYAITPCAHAPLGIRFEQKINFFGLDLFKAGYFEIQDEASQLIAALVAAGPIDHVLDFCAGSGGKALAIAPGMQGKGQLYLHDIRPFALQEAKKRCKRAGVQNFQLCPPDQLRRLKGHMDWVLVDAPCTGTGTLRRNPDMKWKFDSNLIDRITQEQAGIFRQAYSFVKPNGHLVYATCSVLPQENQLLVDRLAQELSLTPIGTPFQSFPVRGEMDGFFGAVFQKK